MLPACSIWTRLRARVPAINPESRLPLPRRLGVVPVAAHQVVTQLWLLSSLVVDSVAIAGQSLVAVQVRRHGLRPGLGVGLTLPLRCLCTAGCRQGAACQLCALQQPACKPFFSPTLCAAGAR